MTLVRARDTSTGGSRLTGRALIRGAQRALRDYELRTVDVTLSRVMLLLGGLIVLTQGSAIAPFIYTLSQSTLAASITGPSWQART